MVESTIVMLYPARSRGVETARMPSGAVASVLANDGKKKTILRERLRGVASSMYCCNHKSGYHRTMSWACQQFVIFGRMPLFRVRRRFTVAFRKLLLRPRERTSSREKSNCRSPSVSYTHLT